MSNVRSPRCRRTHLNNRHGDERARRGHQERARASERVDLVVCACIMSERGGGRGALHGTIDANGARERLTYLGRPAGEIALDVSARVPGDFVALMCRVILLMSHLDGSVDFVESRR